MKRRKFIKKSSILTSASVAVPSFLLTSCRSKDKFQELENHKFVHMSV